MVFKDPSYKVKNTFLEFAAPEADESGPIRGRRARSDMAHGAHGGNDIRHSPLVVAAKSPTCSPQLRPVDETMQAVPIDEVDFEMLEEAAEHRGESTATRTRYGSADSAGEGAAVAQATPGLTRDEPAYVVPTTPSPFLHSAFPPSAVPPFGTYGYGVPDMGLPPAFGEGEASSSADAAFSGQEVDGNAFLQAQYLSEIYDPSYGSYMAYGGWSGLSVEGTTGFSPAGHPSSQLQGLDLGAPAVHDASGGGQATSSFAQVSGAAALRPPKEVPASAFAAAPQPASSAPDVGAQAGTQPDEMVMLERPTRESRRKARKEARDQERAEARAAEREKERSNGEWERGTMGSGEKAAKSDKGGASAAWNGADSAGRAAGGWDKEPAGEKGGWDKEPAGEKGGASELPEACTTVMLRNIPNKYTREMLIRQLSVDFNGQFDFMYLPIDFKNKCNVGYGFINFRKPEDCARFVADFHGVDVRKCLPGLNSKKIVEVTPARVQGRVENVRRLRNSPVMNQLQDHPEWMPLLFNADGEEEPFPNPDQPLPPVKPRGRNREARNLINDE